MSDYMVEMDRFVHRLNVGTNVIERKSIDSSVTIKDKMSYRNLMLTVAKAFNGETSYMIEETYRHCGWPHRMLLPKGKKSGMLFKYFVMVTPFEGRTAGNDLNILDLKSISYCGVKHLDVFPDTFPMGYPFDRVIDHYDLFFTSPNMLWKDVVIYHKKTDDYTPIH